jgi:hypothetical protein
VTAISSTVSRFKSLMAIEVNKDSDPIVHHAHY